MSRSDAERAGRPATRRSRARTWRCSRQQLEGQSAEEILRWAADRYAPRLTFATGLGMEDCVVIDLIARAGAADRSLHARHRPAVSRNLRLWRRLEERYGVTIRAVTPGSTRSTSRPSGDGPELWSASPIAAASCARCSRCAPTLSAFDAWISAIRRDQTPDRADAPVVGWDGKFGLVKVNPLVRWTFDEVKAYVSEHDVPYNPLHDQGYPSIGCLPCTSPVAPGEDPRAGRWRGREKKECGLHLRPVR